jgi:DNA-binding XRE family transcriptional regulator
MKRVKWPFSPKGISAVETLPGLSVGVTWEDGVRSVISLADWIESKHVDALKSPDIFAKGHVGEYASSVAWIDDEIEIDSIHLQLLESEQRGMPLLPDALSRWRAKHKLTQAMAAKELGVSPRQWQNYESGKTFLPWVLALACAGWEAKLKGKAA